MKALSTPSTNANPASLEPLKELVIADMQAINQLILKLAESHVELVPKVARHLLELGGKRIRPMLTVACARLLGNSFNNLELAAACVELIHTATLLHDDVVDESSLRRGDSTANSIWGNKASVLVGDFLLSQAFRMMAVNGDADIMDILSAASIIIVEGEVLQLESTNNLETGFDQYLKVINSKTAELFAAACELGAVIAGKDHLRQSLRNFGMNLGLAFQISDDALDYSANQSMLGKSIGDDFREGKVTLPIILALQKADTLEREFWQRVIGDNQQTEDDFNQALQIINRHDTVNESLRIAESYSQSALECLTKIAESSVNNLAMNALQQAAIFSVTRGY
jgi:octaprenyl-diphosphate synthase